MVFSGYFLPLRAKILPLRAKLLYSYSVAYIIKAHQNKNETEKNTMKKLISLISAAAVLAVGSTATMIHSRADMKVETADFAVSLDRSSRPSAYCRNADGSAVSESYSSSENFCISGMAQGNASLLVYNDMPAYCIGNHLQNAPTSLSQVTKLSDIPYDSEEYGAIFRMAAAGASTGTTEYGLNSTDLCYVTQCAVRTWLYGLNADTFAFFDENGDYNEALTNEFRRILSTADETSVPFTTDIMIDSSLSSAEKIYTEDKCYFRYGPFFPYSEFTELPYYSITETNPDENVILSPFSELGTAESVTEYQSDEQFYVYINSTYENEVVLEITSETQISRYNPVVYLSGDENYQNIFQLSITDNEEKLSGLLALRNTDTFGDLKLNKKFIADNNEISDIKLISQPRFTVKNEEGKYISGIQSDKGIVFDHFSAEPVEFALSSESEIFISGLPVGEYKIYEITGADGYMARETEIEITNTCELNTCIFINESVTTTTEITTTEAPVTTTTSTEITSAETSVTTDTAPVEFTFTVTSETPYNSEITENSETEISESSVSEETTIASVHTVPKFSAPRITGTPKTGDTRFPVTALFTVMTLAAAVITSLKFTGRH